MTTQKPYLEQVREICASGNVGRVLLELPELLRRLEIAERALEKLEAEDTYYQFKREVNGVKEFDTLTVNEIRTIARSSLAAIRAQAPGEK